MNESGSQKKLEEVKKTKEKVGGGEQVGKSMGGVKKVEGSGGEKVIKK